MLLSLYVKAKTHLWGVRDRFTDEDGAVATEYGLLLAFIAIAIIVVVGLLGDELVDIFTDSKDDLANR